MLWNLVLLAFAVCGFTVVASGLRWDRYEWRSAVQTARRVAPIVLFVWLAYWGWQSIAGTFSDYPNHLDTLGVDGRLYYRAAATWLAGGDPWTAYTTTNTWPPGGSQVCRAGGAEPGRAGRTVRPLRASPTRSAAAWRIRKDASPSGPDGRCHATGPPNRRCPREPRRSAPAVPTTARMPGFSAKTRAVRPS